MKSTGWFDLQMACLGALVSGTLVGWINSDHGAMPALTAAFKQGSYAFVATGLIVQWCRWLHRRPVHRALAIGLALSLPLLATIFLLYLLHSLKGTPEPLLSVIPGSSLTLLGLILVSWQIAAERSNEKQGWSSQQRPPAASRVLDSALGTGPAQQSSFPEQEHQVEHTGQRQQERP